MKHILLILIYCLVPIIMATGQDQQAQKLLSEAIYQEEVKGDLDNAIETYQLILSKYPDNRKVSAEVLLHLGMCYEKLGNQEAIKTYKRLVNNFPEQKNQVAVARERLTRLIQAAEKVSATSQKPKFTKIKIPTKLSWSVRLSPDGKTLGLVSDEKIWKMPLFGNIGPDFPGAPVLLNTDGIPVEYTDLSWSTDGKWIAFNDPGMTGPNQRIYIVPSEGGKPEKIIENFRDARVVNYRISLSPNGANLAFSSVEEKKQHIFAISTKGGNPVRLTDMQAREPAFSPDGKMIAFVEDKDLGAGQGGLGLWIIPATGGTPQLLAEAGTASSPVWSPSGNFIAFLDFSQEGLFFGKQINIVPVLKGEKTPGKVTRIDVPNGIGDVRKLAGWTPENKIGALCRTKQEFALYTLPAKGGQASIILPDCYTLQPRYSLNGKQIYFTTPPVEGDNKFYRLMLASVPATGGTGTPLPKDEKGKNVHSLSYQGGNRVSPDGNWIVSATWSSADTSSEIHFPRTKIWKIAVDGSEAIQITNTQGPHADLCPSWSPDGGKIAFIRTSLTGDLNVFGNASIYTINSSGGELKMLISESAKYIFSPVWSPDGKMIAYLTGELPSRSNPTMNVINVTTGESRVIGKVPAANVNIEVAWSPDSKRIAFNGDNLIKVINVDNGEIEDVKTNLVDVDIWHLDWSPDGEQFVFSGMKGGKDEFWFLEDFMPLEKLAQKNEKENATEPEGIRIKQIWKSPYLDDLGTVSFDGRFRSYVDWGVGDVAIQNLITGEKKKLTDKASLGDTAYFALGTAISKDGKTIASSWWKPHNTTDLILVDVENPSLNILYRQKGEEVYPATWLSNNELVATRVFPDKRTLQIISLNILNKTVQVKKTFEKMYNPRLACSSDQKYIAYDFANDADNGNTDINLLLADGDGDIPLIKHPANDRVLGWVPGRKEFLFISDRSGSWDLWAITLDNGKPSGSAKRIYTDIGEVTPMGFTQNGNCYFGFVRRNFNTYIVPFNSETGELKEGSGKSLIGSNIWIKWSPDGQYLAYIKENAKADNPWQLTIQDLKTGEERKIANNLLYARMPCWSPDGNSILVQGTEKNKYGVENYKGGIFLVDVKTGQTSEILLLSDQKYTLPEDDSSPLSDIQWSSDGKSIFYLLFKDRLVKRDLATGKEKILYENPNFERLVLNCSPDGKWLLFGVMDSAKKKNRLLTMSVEGGEVKELCTLQESVKRQAKWSPDGKYIYFTEISDGTSLWRIPSEGGTPQKIWHSKNDTDLFSIRPDGKEIALGIQERTTEMRVIENLVQELEKLDKTPK